MQFKFRLTSLFLMIGWMGNLLSYIETIKVYKDRKRTGMSTTKAMFKRNSFAEFKRIAKKGMPFYLIGFAGYFATMFFEKKHVQVQPDVEGVKPIDFSNVHALRYNAVTGEPEEVELTPEMKLALVDVVDKLEEEAAKHQDKPNINGTEFKFEI